MKKRPIKTTWLVAGALAAALGFGMTTPALAIDCAKASNDIEKRICANKGLQDADEAMGRAYTALLKAAPDPEIRDVLVRSQRRWIDARNHGLDSASVKQLRDAMLERIKVLGNPSGNGLLSNAKAVRQSLAAYASGSFTGFDTNCEFVPNDQDNSSYSYTCTGDIHVQNQVRVCSMRATWATYSTYQYYTVSTVAGDEATPKACCDGQFEGGCGPDGGGSNWQSTVDKDDEGKYSEPGSNLPKIDAEGPSPFDEDNKAWFGQCLSAPEYPPPAKQ